MNTTKTEHTPGPWLYEASTQTIRSVPINYWLATMDSWDGEVTPRNAANARLIAAAPELLEIAKAYRNLLRTMAHTDGELATFAHIESVIAKALNA